MKLITLGPEQFNFPTPENYQLEIDATEFQFLIDLANLMVKTNQGTPDLAAAKREILWRLLDLSGDYRDEHEIETVEDGHIKVLDLQDLNLTIIPKSINLLKQLFWLNLANTPITSLPETIADLGGTLECIACQSCPLSESEKQKLRQYLPQTRLNFK